MSYIKDNIMDIAKEIEEICHRMGRDPKEVQLIAVTKTIDAERIREAIVHGITDVGENKVQEILSKYDDVKNVRWHMIGHLQTNKVKYIIDKVQLIHSLDRFHLAEEINKRAKQINRIMDVLVQVNIAQEETKFGIDAKDVYGFIDQIRGLEHIRIQGLMAMAPFVEDPEEVRIYFRKMKQLFDEIKGRNMPGVEMKYLSMGMTNDYKVAIEEGSNMIRIGTGIFGKRNYQK